MMRIFQPMALVIGLALSSTSLFANTGGPAEKPFMTVSELKNGLVDNIENLDMKALELDDATVDISFVVNKDGDVGIVEVSGENCLVNTYVKQMLRNKRLFVSPELSNKVHTVTVRYVRI